MEDLLQFGALGILGGVLFWGLRYTIPTAVSSVTSSLDHLTEEVASFRKTQSEMIRLMALLLAKEFGTQEAAEMLKGIEREERRDQET